MTIINECNMPDLSSLNVKQVLGFILSRVFMGAGTEDEKCNLLMAHYVRVTDHTLKEYNYTREALKEYINTPNNHLSPYFVALGHLETCLSSLERARKLFEALRERRECPEMPRHRGFIKAGGTKIKDMRSNIQHLDGEIIRGNPIEYPWMKEEKMKLGDTEIPYSTLAKWIREIHEIAEELSIPEDQKNEK